MHEFSNFNKLFKLTFFLSNVYWYWLLLHVARIYDHLGMGPSGLEYNLVWRPRSSAPVISAIQSVSRPFSVSISFTKAALGMMFFWFDRDLIVSKTYNQFSSRSHLASWRCCLTGVQLQGLQGCKPSAQNSQGRSQNTFQLLINISFCFSHHDNNHSFRVNNPLNLLCRVANPRFSHGIDVDLTTWRELLINYKA